MRAAITGEADRLGARATVRPLRGLREAGSERHVERLGHYSLTLDRVGLEPFTVASAYGLPAHEATITKGVRASIIKAARAAEDRRR
jgi:hypothetical protein